MTIYQIALRDRETRTVLGYYNGAWTTDRNGAWTTDRHRAIALPKREVAEDHAAQMRDLCRGMRSLSTSKRSLPPTST